MSYRVKWVKEAERSLDEILNYIIEHDGVIIAHKIYQKIKKQASLLKVDPNIGSPVKELKSLQKDYKQIVISPWKIIYIKNKNIIHILLVIDSRRDLEEILYEMIINIDHD